jgi:hypothetical protein
MYADGLQPCGIVPHWPTPIPVQLMQRLSQVENFQPYYIFNPKKHIRDLQIGAEILQEVLTRESEKQERQERAKREEKAVVAAHKENVRPWLSLVFNTTCS